MDTQEWYTTSGAVTLTAMYIATHGGSPLDVVGVYERPWDYDQFYAIALEAAAEEMVREA